MNINSCFPDGKLVRGILLPAPTSFQSLPKFSGFNQKQIKTAVELEKSFTQQSGLPPGTYTTFSEVVPLINVHEQLWDTLESALSSLDRLDICRRLYLTLETILGHMHQAKYQTSSDLDLSGRIEGA